VPRFFRIKRDYWAGALMILFGAITAHDGTTYPIGTLRQMGPGFFPVSLGILLILLGLIIAATAMNAAGEDRSPVDLRAQLRGWLCIIAGPVLFIVLGQIGGLLPAAFSCVFVSALGDRDNGIKNSAVLAAGITVFGILLFSYLLKIPMPILTWRWL
jgi:putative tricarboxylic transport membrane protein